MPKGACTPKRKVSGMGLMSRIATVFKAKANKMVDRVEDPRETLDYSYQRQLEMLQQVRRALADVATSRKRIELEQAQLQATAVKLEGQARQALAQNREDLARQALTRKAGIATQLTDLETQHQQLVDEQDKMTEASRRLEAKVESFRTHKETIKASYTAAQATTKIDEAVSGISEEMGDMGLAMQRAQDKVEQMQARSGALDELLSSGALEDLSGSTDPIQHQLDQMAQTGAVDADLARLKSELAGASAPAAISASAAASTGARPAIAEKSTEEVKK